MVYLLVNLDHYIHYLKMCQKEVGNVRLEKQCSEEHTTGNFQEY